VKEEKKRLDMAGGAAAHPAATPGLKVTGELGLVPENRTPDPGGGG